MKIGFIGLGAMGRPMALNLVKADHELWVYDLFQAAVDELVKAGAKAVTSPKELGSMDVVITMLPNAAIVEGTMAEIFCTAKAGLIVIDMSSVAPHTSIKMAKLAATKQVEYVDAPVSGGTAGASQGTLTIMVGGKDEVLAKIMPLLQVLGKNVKHIGATGSGDAVKMVNNLLLGANMAVLTEALVLGVKSGLSAETMLDVIKNSSGASYALTAKMPNFIMPGKFAPGFAVDLQYKDLELAVESGKALSLPLPMTNAAQQVYETARAKGLGKEDISALIKIYEEYGQVLVRGEK